MFDSVRPHGQQPTRLLRPWDSPGNNTGVVAISFSNAWKWSEREVAQSCPTLSDPMDCSPPGSSIHRIPGKGTGVGCHCLLWFTPLATFKQVKHCFTRVTMLFVTSPGLICSWKSVPLDHCWCVILILPTPLLSLAPCGFVCIRVRKKLSTWFWCLGEKKLIRSRILKCLFQLQVCLCDLGS